MARPLHNLYRSILSTLVLLQFSLQYYFYGNFKLCVSGKKHKSKQRDVLNSFQRALRCNLDNLRHIFGLAAYLRDVGPGLQY